MWNVTENDNGTVTFSKAVKVTDIYEYEDKVYLEFSDGEIAEIDKQVFEEAIDRIKSKR